MLFAPRKKAFCGECVSMILLHAVLLGGIGYLLCHAYRGTLRSVAGRIKEGACHCAEAAKEAGETVRDHLE